MWTSWTRILSISGLKYVTRYSLTGNEEMEALKKLLKEAFKTYKCILSWEYANELVTTIVGGLQPFIWHIWKPEKILNKRVAMMLVAEINC
jgi:hypothetical protein